MTISGFIAYVKQAWKNKPDTSTPLSAERLMHIEDGVKANSDAIEKIAAAVINQNANSTSTIPSSAALYSVYNQLNSDLVSVSNSLTTAKTNIANRGKVLFSGNQPLDEGGAWISEAFTNFTKIDLSLIYLGQYLTLSVYPQADGSIYSFGWNHYNVTDGGIRIVTGKFQFSGRYITAIGALMSLNGNTFQQMSASSIYVSKIVGYKYS